MKKVNLTTTDKICIGKVIYKDRKYPLYLNKYNGYSRCVSSKIESFIEVGIDWFLQPEDTKNFIIWHELGHLYLNTPNEYRADRFVCERVGYDMFSKHVNTLYRFNVDKITYTTNQKNNYYMFCMNRIDFMIGIKKSIDESFEIIFDEIYNNQEKIQKAWDENFK
jgi:hypothetical protein